MEITSEHGRDFSATLVCEHCKATQPLMAGYNDTFFHTQVVPSIKCRTCGVDSLKRSKGQNPGVGGHEGRGL